MNTDKAITILRAYAACMVSEQCSDCPYKGKCPGWTEEEVLQALHYLNSLNRGAETEPLQNKNGLRKG